MRPSVAAIRCTSPKQAVTSPGSQNVSRDSRVEKQWSAVANHSTTTNDSINFDKMDVIANIHSSGTHIISKGSNHTHPQLQLWRRSQIKQSLASPVSPKPPTNSVPNATKDNQPSILYSQKTFSSPQVIECTGDVTMCVLGTSALDPRRLSSSGIITLTQYSRGGQLDQLWEPHFRWQQSARATSYSCAQKLISSFSTRYSYESLYSTLKFIKSNYCSVLTHEHFAELVYTALIK
jgi:hypothetical protein